MILVIAVNSLTLLGVIGILSISHITLLMTMQRAYMLFICIFLYSI